MTNNSLKGKHIVITGGSSGLGRTMAVDFSKLGAILVLIARDEKNLKQVQSFLHGDKHHVFSADLSKPKEIQRVCQEIEAVCPVIDILINNAAGWYRGSLDEMSVEILENLMAVTITGSILVTKHLLPLIQKAKEPHIINVISTAGHHSQSDLGVSSSTAYCASKWGQAGFSEAIRQELNETPIKVTTLYPSAIGSDEDKERSPHMTRQDVAEAILFCITRPKRMVIHSMVLY